jgi:hypothetical protein
MKPLGIGQPCGQYTHSKIRAVWGRIAEIKDKSIVAKRPFSYKHEKCKHFFQMKGPTKDSQITGNIGIPDCGIMFSFFWWSRG